MSFSWSQLSIWGFDILVFSFSVLDLVLNLRTVTSLGFVVEQLEVHVVKVVVLQIFVTTVLILRSSLWSWHWQLRFSVLVAFLCFVAEDFEVHVVRLLLRDSCVVNHVVDADRVFKFLAAVDRVLSRHVVALACTLNCTDICLRAILCEIDHFIVTDTLLVNKSISSDRTATSISRSLPLCCAEARQ